MYIREAINAAVVSTYGSYLSAREMCFPRFLWVYIVQYPYRRQNKFKTRRRILTTRNGVLINKTTDAHPLRPRCPTVCAPPSKHHRHSLPLPHHRPAPKNPIHANPPADPNSRPTLTSTPPPPPIPARPLFPTFTDNNPFQSHPICTLEIQHFRSLPTYLPTPPPSIPNSDLTRKVTTMLRRTRRRTMEPFLSFFLIQEKKKLKRMEFRRKKSEAGWIVW